MTQAGSSPTPVLRRLYPTPAAPVTVREMYAVDRPVDHDGARPWIGVCMISSLDGSVTVDGTSAGLGNTNDREVLLTLRAIADVVIVGAGTARGEGYGAPAGGVRIGVVTNSGRIDPSSELFRSGSGFVITTESAPTPDGIEVVRAGTSAVDLGEALTRLGQVVADVRHVHVEGGPTLNAALLAADLVDELALTIAPMTVGGPGPRVAMGGVENVRRFDLAHLLIDDDGYTFGRWTRRPHTPDRPANA